MNYDKKALRDKCTEHQIEYTEIKKDNKIIFMCPKMPDELVKTELSNMVSKDIGVHFIESPKVSTSDAVSVILKSIGFAGVLYEHKHKLFIHTEQSLPEDHPFWKEIKEILLKDGYFWGWEITLGKRTVKYNRDDIVSPFFTKSSASNERNHIINDDDMDKLKINLGRKLDVLDFLKEMS